MPEETSELDAGPATMFIERPYVGGALSYVLEAVGVGALVAGVAGLAGVWWGLLVAGVLLIVGGVAVSR